MSNVSRQTSYENIHDDYRFFLEHCNEHEVGRGAMLEEIFQALGPVSALRWLDFGCGGGEFLAEALEQWTAKPASLRLSLVDVDSGYVEQAMGRVNALVDQVEGSDELESLSGPFDLITSNHALYFAADIEATLKGLNERLAEGGLCFLQIGGLENQFCRMWTEAYSKVNQPVPYYIADDFAVTLEKLGIAFSTRRIDCVTRFADTVENRKIMLNFIFMDAVGRFDEAYLLSLFDRYSTNGQISMENNNLCFLVRK
ncbi:class I SAM-dependent methyltransferase [Rubellicoccus peritrichatus]|uniref:Class I SAM-dependent methyltransferase n=1 Tax=Rubellicoccus peritrichatus TaxID=3080537 RepID=A0AAQ3L958_9BACT|nr:class I SAM-dependent methyltransferase [Puniceicoccus sp. CR14]WOO41660.1 class I SAM-dependent methyltransferase [Puniceicoccus sp. CR14]